MHLRMLLLFVVSLLIDFGHCDRINVLEGQGLKEAFTWSKLSYVLLKSDCYGKASARSSSIQRIPQKNAGELSAYTDNPRVVISESNVTLNFIYENNVPMGANRWKNKLFISVPRRRDGVLSTLNYVPMHSLGKHNVPLIPYPDFETNRQVEPAEADVDRFVSVYRVAVDVCDRLWFADTGRVQTIGNNRRIKPQTLYVMDLHTDKIIRKYRFKDTDTTDDMNGLFSVTVDTTIRTCNDAFAYLPDSLGGGIVVYSFKSDDSWRFEDSSFVPEPNQNGFLVGGIPLTFHDGVFSISLGEIKGNDGFRDAYYHSMIGLNLYKVSTKVLKNKNLAAKQDNSDAFKLVGRRLENSQTTNSALHLSSGLMFFAMVAQNAVGCWNSNFPFRATDFGIVYKNDVKMIYPSDLKIYKDELIVMSNRFPVFYFKELNYEDVNFRVFMNTVYDAVRGTKCAGYYPSISPKLFGN